MNGVMNLYAIFDKIAESAGFIFESANDGTAVRSMRSSKDTMSAPDDYKLVKLGSFDHKTIKLTVLEAPQEINWKGDNRLPGPGGE